MKVGLAGGLSVSDALLENIFGFLDELSMQVNGIAVDPPKSIIFPEDEVGCLLVVLFHHCAMSFPFF